MGQTYLIDSNILIDYLANNITSKGTSFIDNISPTISVISRIEILGWYKATPEQINRLKSFINNIIAYPLNEKTILKTIELRQAYRIKTPDAIIAATALINNLTLISRDVNDFAVIPTLRTINPWTL